MQSENWSLLDRQHMAMALKLAAQGRFTTTPNPNVGCVIVDQQGQLLGRGWHQQAGTPHAEIHALAQAADHAKGATVYVTLEPCNHSGKTGPCTEALIQAGVARVVAAMQDPNPLVSGKGLKRLADNNIEVSVGLMRDQAAVLNKGFLKRMRSGLPWVTVKLASSLDGKTALANGRSQWITGEQARRDVQLARAASCAILSGSGTVLADDPSLTVRYPQLDGRIPDFATRLQRQPLRIIIDGHNRLPSHIKMFDLPGETLLVNTASVQLPEGIGQWQAPVSDGHVCLQSTLKHLASRGCNQVWVEAGAGLAGALIKNKLVDELIFYQAPKLMGDKAKDLVLLPEISSMSNVLDLTYTDIRMLGRDVKITAVLSNS